MLTCIAQAGAKMYLHGRACQEHKRTWCASAFCTTDPLGITALLFIRARSQARSLSLLSRSLFLDPSVTGIRSAARASGMFLPSTPRGSQSTRQAPSRRTLLLRQLAQRRRADGRGTRPLKGVQRLLRLTRVAPNRKHSSTPRSPAKLTGPLFMCAICSRPHEASRSSVARGPRSSLPADPPDTHGGKPPHVLQFLQYKFVGKRTC